MGPRVLLEGGEKKGSRWGAHGELVLLLFPLMSTLCTEVGGGDGAGWVVGG